MTLSPLQQLLVGLMVAVPGSMVTHREADPNRYLLKDKEQDEEEKQRRLAAAEAKRARKALKRK